MRKSIALVALVLGSPCCGGSGGGNSAGGAADTTGGLGFDLMTSTVHQARVELSGSLQFMADPPGTQVSWANSSAGTAGTGQDLLTDVTYWLLGYSWTETVHKWYFFTDLVPGPNVITVTATDNQGRVATGTTTLTYVPPLPVVHILQPWGGPTWNSADSPLTLSGSASSPLGIVSVDWSNDLTAQTGFATGTTSWEAVVPLSLGTNPIHVRAVDVLGGVSTATLSVLYPAANPLPTITVTTPGPLSTAASTVEVTGTAASVYGIDHVDCVCAETGFWESESGTGVSWDFIVKLTAHPNHIVVTAWDFAGGSASVTIVATSTAEVLAWGSNSGGELGFPTSQGFGTPEPQLIGGLSGVTALAAGFDFSLALRDDGGIVAWGGNSSGQLGSGLGDTADVRVPVAGLSGVVAIAAGMTHGLALRGDGSVWAWGDNWGGQLGDGTRTSRPTPVPVLGLSGVVAISAGDYFSVALLGDGTVRAWGWSNRGALGSTGTDFVLTPVSVPGLSGATAVSAGLDHVAALMPDGTVRCWGSNASGQLGDPAGPAWSATPTAVPGLSGATSVSAGGGQTLAVTSDGGVWMWGNGLSPAPVPGLAGVRKAVSGPDFAAALESDGSVWVWGANDRGQLGPVGVTVVAVPQALPGLSGMTDLAAGRKHMLGRAGP